MYAIRSYYETSGYLAEVDDMYDMPVWRMLAGPCFGHAREHVGEIRANLQPRNNFV